MSTLKKFFPYSFGADSVASLVIKIIIYLCIPTILGIVTAIIGIVPIIGWIIAILKGIPYLEICFIKVMKVSDAKIIDVNTKTPIKNTAINCFNKYLSKSFKFLYV